MKKDYNGVNRKLVKNGFFDINKMLVRLFNCFVSPAESKNLTLVCNLTCEQPDCFIWSDEKKLKTIMENLLDNALKYTESGEIVFGYQLGEADRLILYVRDTGIGIKADEAGEIFDLYYRSPDVQNKRIEGKGIGLTIVSQLAEMLGAEIKIETEHGKGSCFWCILELDNKGQD